MRDTLQDDDKIQRVWERLFHVAGRTMLMADATAVCEPKPLSEREISCLRLSALGVGDEEISRKLQISRCTVRFHLRNVCRKLFVNSRRHAIYIAAKRSII